MVKIRWKMSRWLKSIWLTTEIESIGRLKLRWIKFWFRHFFKEIVLNEID